MLLLRNSPAEVSPAEVSPARAPAGRRRGSARRWAIAVVAASGAVLLPWSAYLAVTLPPAVTARHWPLVWAGLDGAIAAGLGTSAWLAIRRDHRLGPVTAATASLMAADAWFDVCTSPAGHPLALAIIDMTVEAGVAATCLLLPRMTGLSRPPSRDAVAWPSRTRCEAGPGSCGVHAEPGKQRVT